MNRIKRFIALSAAFLGALSAGTVAQAALITSNTMTGALVINFDGTSGSNVIGNVQIGAGVGENITVSSSSDTNGLFFNFNGWGLPNNGNWGDGRTFVGLNGSTDDILFAFNSGPVAEVGGFMSYARRPGFNLTISALDASMSVLESYDVTALADIIDTSFNGGAFRGISRAASDISYFRVSGGLANALDDLTFARSSAVPEPGTLALIAMAALCAGLAQRRRHTA